MSPLCRVLVLCCALPVALLGAGSPQAAPQPPAPPQPAFRSEVELKTLFVTVLDRGGAPLDGLTMADFRVTVDGQPRRIVSVEPIKRRAPASSDAPIASASLVSTNARVPAGQLVMLVVDETSLRSGSRSAIQASNGLLDALPESDLVGLAILPGGPNIPFTRDRAPIREAIARVRSRWQPQDIGQATLSDNEALALVRGDGIARSTVIERECRPPSQNLSPEQRQAQIDSCLNDIENVARGLVLTMENEGRQSLQFLSGVLDRVYVSEYEGPTAVVLISGGLTVVSPPGEIPAIVATAARANAVVHTVLPDPSMADVERQGLRSSPSLASREAAASGLQALSGLSGGRFIPATGNASGVFSTLARELSAGYRVAIELQPGDTDGKLHRVRVETSAPRTTVRSHQHFLGSDGGYRPPAELLASALRNQRILTGVPLKVSTYARQGETPERIEVVVAGEIGPEEPGAAQVLYRLTDDKGREVLSGDSEVTVEAGPAGQPGRGTFLARGEVPPGTYALKVAVAGPRGTLGSVEHPVSALLKPFEAWSAGDLFLAPGTGQDGGRVRPVADCEVAGQPLIARLELYGRQGAPSAGLRPVFEVAPADGGAALIDVPMDAAPSEDRSRLVAQTTVATSLLPAGDYVGRVLATAGGARLEVARRPFRVLPVDPASLALDPEKTGGAEAAHAVIDALRSIVPRFSVKDVLRPDTAERDLQLAVRRSGSTSPVVAGIPSAAGQGALTFDSLDATVEREAPLVAAMGRGISLLEAGRFEVAAPQFNRATTLASDYLTALVYLGACYAGQGRDADAVGVWQTAMVIEDGSSRLYRLAGDALLRRGQVDDAVELLREAISTWPDDSDLSYRLALALALAEQRAEAVKTLDPLLSSAQASPDAIFLGLLLLQQARLAGQPLVSAAADRERLERLALAYEAGDGTRKPLVRAWAKALGAQPR